MIILNHTRLDKIVYIMNNYFQNSSIYIEYIIIIKIIMQNIFQLNAYFSLIFSTFIKQNIL